MEQLAALAAIIKLFLIGCVLYTIGNFLGWLINLLGVCIGACG